MTIYYPTNRQEIVDRVKTDVQNELPQSEPFLRNSYLSAFCIGMATSFYDLYVNQQALQQQMFPDTATGDFADRWASYKGITRNAATASSGYITIAGVAGITIPAGTIFSTDSNIQYKTLSDAKIAAQSVSVATLTRSDGIAYATTADVHHLVDGASVSISGAAQSEYNITADITVTSTTKFNYPVSGAPITPATGTILASYTFASIEIIATSYGEETNLDSGTELNIVTPISGVDSSAYVQYEGLTGGTDAETDDAFRTRYLYAYQNPISYWNESFIVTQCRKVNGVDRVFVQSITPDIGQITIYFTMSDDDVIPSSVEVDNVKNKLLEVKPADRDPEDIIVMAPTPVPVSFSFSALTPNTATMQQAIIANLKQMFKEVPSVGEDLSQYAYESAIYQSVDPATGKYVTAFSLTSPVGDITCATGELATYGGCTFP